MNNYKIGHRIVTIIALVAIFSGFYLGTGTMPAANAAHTLDPSSVTIAGSLQSELGCSGDWQPECIATRLVNDPEDDVWQAVFAVPAGRGRLIAETAAKLARK